MTCSGVWFFSDAILLCSPIVAQVPQVKQNIPTETSVITKYPTFGLHKFCLTQNLLCCLMALVMDVNCVSLFCIMFWDGDYFFNFACSSDLE